MATDYHLKIAGIEGESLQKGFEKQITLLSWSWGESNNGSFATNSGGGAGKVNMQDFHFTMKLCKASTALFRACATGQHIPEATLTCRKPGTKGGQVVYLVYKFKDLLISSYQTGGSDGSNEIPTDSISFNYSAIEIEYFEQGADGSTKPAGKAGYDMKKNTPIG